MRNQTTQLNNVRGLRAPKPKLKQEAEQLSSQNHNKRCFSLSLRAPFFKDSEKALCFIINHEGRSPVLQNKNVPQEIVSVFIVALNLIC